MEDSQQQQTLPTSISLSREQEMKQNQESQEKFHLLVKQYMQSREKKKATFTSIAHCALSLFTAPLLTLSTSLQCTVQKNVITIEDFQQSNRQQDVSFRARTSSLKSQKSIRPSIFSINDKNALAKSNKSIGLSLPYKPPVYRVYFEAIAGLYKQGFRAYYKGNGIRCLHIILFHKLNTEMQLASDGVFKGLFENLAKFPLGRELFIACAIDFVLHPLHLAEARFIMQNRCPNFSIYQNLSQVFTKSSSELLRGIMLHIPRNVCIALSLAYPFLTVQRRIECQSKLAGLLNLNEYKGTFDCFKKIFQQEGFSSFYRGFNAYILAILFWMSVLPLATDWFMSRVQLRQNPQEQQQGFNNKWGMDEDEDEED